MNLLFGRLGLQLTVFLASFFYCFNLTSQTFILTGKVVDSGTKEPLPFVNIIVNNGNTGGITDLDGKFTIRTIEKPEKLKLSYVGYEPVEIEIIKLNDLHLEMTKTSYQLGEVVIIPGENPAHRIIQNAINHRDKNNPMKLASFQYKSYNRFYVSPDMELISARANEGNDSAMNVYRNFFEKQYLFLMESISQKKFLYPDFIEERVIASRVAGFKDPIFTLLMTQIQSFAFYEDFISISDKNYVNPISKGSTQKYFFLLEDTLYDGKDSIFVISFRPSRGKRFDGLQGLLYIHTDRWAIQNVIASPARSEKGFGMRIQQQYERIGQDSVWFPVQLNTEITFNNVSLNELELFGTGRTYLYDIVINPNLRKKEFSDAQILFDTSVPDAENELKMLGQIYGSTKDTQTYVFLDSLSKENKFERLLNLLKVLSNGKLSISFFDIPLFSIINFNDFEGWRAGLGLETNNRVHKKFSVGGFCAWGFTDKALKYGTHLQYRNSNRNDLTIKLGWKNDVSESGMPLIFDYQTTILDASTYRTFLFKIMDYYSEYSLHVSGRLRRFVRGYLAYDQRVITAGDDYLYGAESEGVFIGTSVFNSNVLSAGIEYNPNVKMIKGLDYQIGLTNNYSSLPILKVNLQAATGKKGYRFNAIDISFEKSFLTKYVGTTNILIEAGIVDRPVPYPFMRVIPAAYRSFNLYIPRSFLTVRMNEFVSNMYVYLFGKHNFGKLLTRNKYFSPGISVALNAAWGSLYESQQHRNRVILAPEKGYFETGIIVDDIVRYSAFSFGIATFYRLGAYSLQRPAENLSLMISFLMAL